MSAGSAPPSSAHGPWSASGEELTGVEEVAVRSASKETKPLSCPGSPTTTTTRGERPGPCSDRTERISSRWSNLACRSGTTQATAPDTRTR